MNQECTDEFLLFLRGASRVSYGNQLPANGSSPGGRALAWNDDAGASDGDNAGSVAIEFTWFAVGAPYYGDLDGDGGVQWHGCSSGAGDIL
jgi:hypothetical protein